VIYENPSSFHNKNTLDEISEKRRNLIEFKKYESSCNINCMLSESLYQSYLYYIEKKGNKLYLDIYETSTGNKIYSLNDIINIDTFKNLVLKGNTLINLYSYEVVDIFQAINQENIKLLKYFSKNKKNLTKTDGLNMTPLNYALYKKKYDLVKYLLAESHVIYDEDIDGITPLHRIAQWGNIELFKKYYFNFLNNMVTKNKENFLHYALISGNIKLINYLLNNGFSLEDKTKLNENSLHFLAESGNLETFKIIYEKYKDITDIAKTGMNILHFAAKSGNFELFKYIEKILKEKNFDIKKNQFDKYHRNYLFYSVLGNKEDYIKNFIDLGQKFENDINNDTALHYAVKEDKIKSIRDLLRLGLSPKDNNKQNKSPILLGFRYLILKDLKEMLNDMTFTDLRDENGLTPLHYAVLGNRFKTINYLLSHGIDINTKSKFGENSLFFALLSKSEALFLYLYYRGVSSDAILENGETILHISAQEKNPWFFNFLLNHNVNIYIENKQKEFPLDIAIKEDNLSVIKSLDIKHKIEFYRSDSNNNRALEKIILFGHKNLFDYMIKEDIRVDVPNANHECALDIAIRLKRLYMISKLNKIGAPRCKD
jgi:ankyrin repeat protein